MDQRKTNMYSLNSNKTVKLQIKCKLGKTPNYDLNQETIKNLIHIMIPPFEVQKKFLNRI